MAAALAPLLEQAPWRLFNGRRRANCAVGAHFRAGKREVF